MDGHHIWPNKVPSRANSYSIQIYEPGIVSLVIVVIIAELGLPIHFKPGQARTGAQ